MQTNAYIPIMPWDTYFASRAPHSSTNFVVVVQYEYATLISFVI